METKKITSQTELLTEIDNFINTIPIQGKNILIKPNFVSLDPYPYTTSPDVLNAVIRCLRRKGAVSIIVADLPSADYSNVFCKNITETTEIKNIMNEFHQLLRNTTNRNDEISYLNSIKRQVGYFYDFFFDGLHINDGRIIQEIVRLDDSANNFHYNEIIIDKEISSHILDLSSYLVINLPVLKLHTTTGFTGATKNLYALFDDASKLLFHKYKCVSKALVALSGYLEGVEIYTFLDARLLPDSQQAIWGTRKNVVINTVVYGQEFSSIDRVALEVLNQNKIDINAKDSYFLDCLQER